ncbi:hypothetical protein [Anaplasma marginale]|nr:hypothetical protein [Anaplasma marginale]
MTDDTVKVLCRSTRLLLPKVYIDVQFRRVRNLSIDVSALCY